jgi:hypothetical protein
MTTRIITDSNGRKHITNEPLLHTPQRTWVGLTKDEVETLSYKAEGNTWKAAELAEAKLKEKNSG